MFTQLYKQFNLTHVVRWAGNGTPRGLVQLDADARWYRHRVDPVGCWNLHHPMQFPELVRQSCGDLRCKYQTITMKF